MPLALLSLDPASLVLLLDPWCSYGSSPGNPFLRSSESSLYLSVSVPLSRSFIAFWVCSYSPGSSFPPRRRASQPLDTIQGNLA